MSRKDLDVLLDMGFDEERVHLALQRTSGLQGALTWLEDHQDDNVDDLKDQYPAQPSESTNTSLTREDSTNPTTEPKSYKCNDCGRLLKNWDAVQLHAERTEHQNFDESVEELKPLSEEEKAAKLVELRTRLLEKRKQQDIENSKDAKKNEMIRRKRDQDSEKLKAELRAKQQLQDIEKRKQEKLEDLKARAKVKAEIAATQQARRDAAMKAKNARDQSTTIAASVAEQVTPTSLSTASYSEARLRFQLPGGGSTTKVFPATTSLFEVAASVSQEVGREVASFTTTFPPRKKYEISEPIDSGLTLKEANLVPSASLIVG